MKVSKHVHGRLAAWLVAAALGVAAGGAWAGNGIAQLRQFVQDTKTARGEFEQTVLAGSGRKPQKASGSFVFSRPGKFRWAYEEPYPQLLVSDGEKLWSWDRDLNQVTVKRLGDALGSTPAAILAGSGALDREFELSDGGSSDGLEWVVAKPRQAESSFESMRLGLSGGMLRRMELRDNFGQTTLIVFSALDAGVSVDPAQFRFEPPPGADVIGD